MVWAIYLIYGSTSIQLPPTKALAEQWLSSGTITMKRGSIATNPSMAITCKPRISVLEPSLPLDAQCSQFVCTSSTTPAVSSKLTYFYSI
jgi:hypothetical protein